MKEEMQYYELEINKSRFLAYKLDLDNLEQVKPFLEKLKKEHKRICELYDALQDSYAKEKKKMEQAPQQLNELKHKYNDLQAEHEQLQADYMELSNKYNAIIGTKREKGRPKKEVRASIKDIKARMKQGETAEQIANELGISRMTLFRRLKSNKNE